MHLSLCYSFYCRCVNINTGDICDIGQFIQTVCSMIEPKLIFNTPSDSKTCKNYTKKNVTLTVCRAAAENGGGVNRQRRQTGQCRLFSHQLCRLRDVKHTTEELLGERAGRWQGVRVLSLPRIRILCRRERKVVCWGQRATMSCYTFEGRKKKNTRSEFSVSAFSYFCTLVLSLLPCIHLSHNL